jgi:hypothetical protein
MCAACYYNAHPDEARRQYKRKEHYVKEVMDDNFGDLEITYDKHIEGGCSQRRPDWFIECYTHTVIVECDENQHRRYSCENKRMMQLFRDLGNRPIVLLRFNPDAYTADGTRVSGCFRFRNQEARTGLEMDHRAWRERCRALVSAIEHHVAHVPTKEVDVVYLFYDSISQ